MSTGSFKDYRFNFNFRGRRISISAKQVIAAVIGVAFLGVASVAVTLIVVNSNLPQLITVADYEPLLTSEVFDRNGKKIGEFYRERRILIPYEEIPEVVKQAFLAAEDDSFFEHGGVNYIGILRAIIANIKAGRKVQGASTITQQVARTLLLTRKKTYTRKIREILLAYRMEENLSKEDILYLYLNQIYLGQGAYGVGAAAKIYYRKDVREINVAEAALLAGLPKAPSRYSPKHNPQRAKERQRYVLKRMGEENYVSEEDALASGDEPLQFYIRDDFKETAPYYLETVRQLLVQNLGEEMVLDKGIRIHTGLDAEKQKEAQLQLREGLRELDKRQGYRGPVKNLEDQEEIVSFLLEERNSLMDKISPVRVLTPEGSVEDKGPLNLTGYAPLKEGETEPQVLPNVPNYINIDQIVRGIVIEVDDDWGLVTVRFAESKGLIDVETMEWAREPDPKVNVRWAQKITTPSKVLKKGDVILIRVTGKTFRSKRVREKLSDQKKEFRKKYRNQADKKWERPETLPEFKPYARIELEQDPVAQGALLSLDQDTGDVLALVGGYDFDTSKFNRAYQAARQTGSAFKALVYMAALDRGYTPATAIIDAPIVFEEEGQIPDGASDEEISKKKVVEGEGGVDAETIVKRWKPMNHSNRFIGDILFRNALIKSLNVPTVKIIEKIGVPWVADYAKRLGIFSPLNMDYTLALGSSSVTLYEITKAFSQIGRLGRRANTNLVTKVEDKDGKVVLQNVTLDERFKEELEGLNEDYEERRLAYLDYKKNPSKYQTSDSSAERDNASDINKDSDESSDEAKEEDGESKSKRNMAKEPPFFFKDPDQLLDPKTAFVTTAMLKAVISEKGGTGGAARALGRPAAGKTGTTNGYYDAWFVGYTPQIATGVWVGFDNEKSLGSGEVGGRAALPIWLEYMKFAHEGMPQRNFSQPEGVLFANIDKETGKLASADSKEVVRQAFIEGSEPQEISGESSQEDEQDFYKEDLSE